MTAVYKKTINLKLHFFNNCFGDEISKGLCVYTYLCIIHSCTPVSLYVS